MSGFGIRRAIYNHNKTIDVAREILRTECGKRHKLGEHGLCPLCEDWKRNQKTEQGTIYEANKGED